MRVEGREQVPLAIDEAWRRINDPETLRACTPGLERLEETSADHYEALLEVRVPAITGRFTGTLEFLERREPELLRLRMKGKGPPGFVDGEVTLHLSPRDGGTEVHYEANVQVGGQVARLGQRMISGVTQEMAGQFFEAFAKAGDDAPPTQRPNAMRSFLVLVWRTLLNLLGLSRRS